MSEKRNARSGERPAPTLNQSRPTGSSRYRRVAMIAIIGSFTFSAGLMAWAFSLPFRSGSLSSVDSLEHLPEAELARLEPEARLSPEAYVDYAWEKDRRLLEQVREKYRVDRQWSSQSVKRQSWRARVQRRKNQLAKMRGELGEKEFPKGTIEWQNQLELQKIIEDAPPGA
jgi:hypothetical protein